MSGSPAQPKIPFTEKPFPWSKASIDAAVLLADDVLTDEQIAAEAKVTDRTLRNWKKHPEFRAKIAEHIDQLQERARTHGLARLDKRMAAYTDRHTRMTELIEARAEAAGKGVGSETGTIVKSIKIVGAGENAHAVEEWSFDHTLMRELRELEKQVAQDTGQWSEKREISGPDGGPIPITTIAVVDSPEDDS